MLLPKIERLPGRTRAAQATSRLSQRPYPNSDRRNTGHPQDVPRAAAYDQKQAFASRLGCKLHGCNFFARLITFEPTDLRERFR
jgi:hypothetical protein